MYVSTGVSTSFIFAIPHVLSILNYKLQHNVTKWYMQCDVFLQLFELYVVIQHFFIHTTIIQQTYASNNIFSSFFYEYIALVCLGGVCDSVPLVIWVTSLLYADVIMSVNHWITKLTVISYTQHKYYVQACLLLLVHAIDQKYILNCIDI